MQAVAPEPRRDDRPHEDHFVILRGVSWADYQRMLEVRGDQPAPRISYLEGRLEIMSPSESHERIKSMIGRLVEVWCLEKGIEFTTLGSWTLEDKAVERGVEPDECYVFGPASGATRPNLAIEVIVTSGGISKLEIYRKLGVGEVWIWRRGELTAHALRGESYDALKGSECLRGIDLGQIAELASRPTTSAAIREYREQLRAPRA